MLVISPVYDWVEVQQKQPITANEVRDERHLKCEELDEHLIIRYCIDYPSSWTLCYQHRCSNPSWRFFILSISIEIQVQGTPILLHVESIPARVPIITSDKIFSVLKSLHPILSSIIVVDKSWELALNVRSTRGSKSQSVNTQQSRLDLRNYVLVNDFVILGAPFEITAFWIWFSLTARSSPFLTGPALHKPTNSQLHEQNMTLSPGLSIQNEPGFLD